MNKTMFAGAALVGLLATPLSFADNSATDYYDGTAMIGAAALRAEGSVCDDQGFCRVLHTELKNSGTPKDLIIGLSFETALMTETVVRSKGGSKSSATADAKIEMYVKVDGVMAAPGTVTFDRRKQELWASLGGVLECSDVNLDGVITFDECTLTEEEIGLILDTTQASTFNFLAFDIGSGSHAIEAYARLSRDGEVVNDASWNASASLGKGTLSAWETHGAMTN